MTDTQSNDIEIKLIYNPSPKVNPDWMVKNNINMSSIPIDMAPTQEEYEAARQRAAISPTEEMPSYEN